MRFITRHADVARGIEQSIESVTYVEQEGANTSRVDFRGEMSVWLSTYEGRDRIMMSGRVSEKIHRQLLALLGRDFPGKVDMTGLAQVKKGGNE